MVQTRKRKDKRQGKEETEERSKGFSKRNKQEHKNWKKTGWSTESDQLLGWTLPEQTTGSTNRIDTSLVKMGSNPSLLSFVCQFPLWTHYKGCLLLEQPKPCRFENCLSFFTTWVPVPVNIAPDIGKLPTNSLECCYSDTIQLQSMSQLVCACARQSNRLGPYLATNKQIVVLGNAPVRYSWQIRRDKTHVLVISCIPGGSRLIPSDFGSGCWRCLQQSVVHQPATHFFKRSHRKHIVSHSVVLLNGEHMTYVTSLVLKS